MIWKSWIFCEISLTSSTITYISILLQYTYTPDFIKLNIFVLIFTKSWWFSLKLKWYWLFCCLSGKYFINLKFVGSKQVTAAIAFLLALFSHILNHVVIRLRNALYEKENPNKLLHHEEEQATGKEYILFENSASLKKIYIYFWI